MASYEVVKVCAYVQDGRVVRHRRPGAHIELDNHAADQLGDAVKPLRRPREPKTKPDTTTKAAPPSTPPPAVGGGAPTTADAEHEVSAGGLQ